ncbi:MAG: CreA family protein [Burkholderiales bacterium]|nr:CreA family protein [Burkholderiales bacterium]
MFRYHVHISRAAGCAALVFLATTARAEDVGCTSTTFHLFSPNDKVCVQAFDDPRVLGVTCHISQAKTGGWKGAVGVAEDPSRFSITCHQVGPIAIPADLPKEESVFSESTSLIFKNTKVVRMFDAKRNTLVYVAISKRVIEGSPMNAISAVPIMPWTGR